MKLSDLAAHLGATLHGDPTIDIDGIAGIERAIRGQVTFVSNKKYGPLAHTTQASAVIVDRSFPELAVPTLRVPDPQLAYARTIELF